MPFPQKYPLAVCCPSCGSTHTSSTRTVTALSDLFGIDIGDDRIRVRRRHCKECLYKFYTVQPPEQVLPPSYKVTFHGVDKPAPLGLKQAVTVDRIGK